MHISLGLTRASLAHLHGSLQHAASGFSWAVATVTALVDHAVLAMVTGLEYIGQLVVARQRCNRRGSCVLPVLCCVAFVSVLIETTDCSRPHIDDCAVSH